MTTINPAGLTADQWAALVWLHDHNGRENAAMLRVVAKCSREDLQALAALNLVRAYRGDTEVRLERRTFLPLVQIRTTDGRGSNAAKHVAHTALALKMLADVGRTGMPVAKWLRASDTDVDTLGNLHAARMVELVTESGQAVEVTRAVRAGSGVAVRLITVGREYAQVAR